MNCEEALDLLKDLASGELSGEKARAVRMHLASCAACTANLNPSEWVEILPAVDDTIAPSEDFALRFREIVKTRSRSSWSRIADWRWPRQIAAAGSLAALLLAGIFISRYNGLREERTGKLVDLQAAENLPLLEDMPVIGNIDLLEDFDTIEILPRLMKEESKN
jgi:anti-sigma factor RsiW